jgi:predicted ATPase
VITELRLKNARLYEGSKWTFPLSNLTILCGTNSAGKSTVLKSLLLLRENLLRAHTYSTQSVPRLRFSTSFMDLGNFKSFVSHNETSRDLYLGVSITALMDIDNYRQLDPRINEDLSEDQENIESPEYSLNADFCFGQRLESMAKAGSSAETKQLSSDDNEEDSSAEHRAILKHASFAIHANDGRSLLSFSVIIKQNEQSGTAQFFLRLPKAYALASTEISQAELVEDDDPDYVLFRVLMSSIVPDRIFARPRLAEISSEDISTRPWPLPSHVEEVLADLRNEMNRIIYLGPLRAPAKRYYPVQADINLQADVTGESLPYLLRDRLSSAVISADPVTHRRTRARLSDALNSWLYFLRTGDTYDLQLFTNREFRINSLQDVLVEMGIKSVDGVETHALADSGFGYSQLLPILVRGLMLQAGTTMIIEQPEVHLNPALQVRLANFLVAMASVGKQILIETHSEHVVNSVRAIAAERDGESVSQNCTVIYLESVQGVPKLHTLSVLPDGTVPDWPPSFFGESSQLLGRILKAQRLRKK